MVLRVERPHRDLRHHEETARGEGERAGHPTDVRRRMHGGHGRHLRARYAAAAATDMAREAWTRSGARWWQVVKFTGTVDPVPRLASRRPWLISLILVTGVGPLATDTYISSLPEVRATLGTTSTVAQLTLTFFIAGMAIGQLLSGPVSVSCATVEVVPSVARTSGSEEM